MPRARLALGSHGVISVTGQRQVNGRWASVSDGTKADRYRATTRYRDRDGNTRTVERFAKTKGLARAKINQAIANFENEEELRANASTRKTLAASAKVWLELVERDATLADKSKAHYWGTWERCIKGTDLAAMPLVQVNVVSTLRAFLQRVADERGTASARSVRSVLSGILGLATEDGVLPMNACRSLRPVRAKNERETTRDIRRALTADERNRLLAVAEAHPRAISQDVTDVIAFMAATGVRVGEALGLQWKDVNWRDGTVHVRGTKSRSSDRVLAMPASLADRLRQRAEATGGSVTCSPRPSSATE